MTQTSAALVFEKRDDRDPLIDLMSATADGDRRAFARIYELTSGRLFPIASRIVRDQQLGEEVLQDAFLTIWRKAGQYSPDRGTPLAWMIAIVRNRAIDKLRQLQRSGQHRPIEDCSNEPALVVDPHELLERNNVGGKVRACIESLPANYQRALLCAYYYGMTHEELAQRFDAPLGTVKSWVRRGLSQLRDALEDELGGEACLTGERLPEFLH